jgi:uncharacterized 2Fe-2S/4Fe-4S cluster protein (DUF4445 family)
MVVDVKADTAMAIIEGGLEDSGIGSIEGGQGAFAPDGQAHGFGVAVDIGTTTIVTRLCDLAAGRALATVATMNPQAAWGADVISRISAAEDGALESMTGLVRRCVANSVEAAWEAADISVKSERRRVEKAVLTGNTVMEHIAAGLSPASIGQAPFEPLSLFGDTLALRDIGLSAWFAPAVAGYVGGDVACGLLYSGVLHADGPQLFIDLGTNGEIALAHDGRVLCCATAAGPVFEGASIRFGMPALPGAISHVAILPDGQVALRTIADAEPRGICGSGILSAVAAMLDAGVVDRTGLMHGDYADGAAFNLTPDGRLFVTQGDVRELQLAKAAIQAGVLTLLDQAGIKDGAVARLVIAGGFGAALDKRAAARVGLMPAELATRTVSVGNSAIEGAQAALLSSKARQELVRIARRCEYIELTTSAAFSQRFMDCICF